MGLPLLTGKGRLTLRPGTLEEALFIYLDFHAALFRAKAPAQVSLQSQPAFHFTLTTTL